MRNRLRSHRNGVYPRVCGGTRNRDFAGVPLHGLSPRVRGNPECDLAAAGWERSIPACAGEPAVWLTGMTVWAVYPRVCGGTRRPFRAAALRQGLSPRVRGNPEERRTVIVTLGSIPACAGEPGRVVKRFRLYEVYPRVCGGTRRAQRRRRRRRLVGLSPRVRGNHRSNQPPAGPSRSIPACAGEPTCSASASRAGKVYPRVCGGTWYTFIIHLLAGGLSPRVRGNPEERRTVIVTLGSIPACAGEPTSTYRPRFSAQVYPRVCGGTAPAAAYATGGHGLSPRVRGNRALRRWRRRPRRSIPACAGEPGPARSAILRLGVYPRVCGGTRQRDHGNPLGAGLSPRVRGNRLDGPGRRGRRGSIPACAGEPYGRDGMLPLSGVYPRVCGGTAEGRR